MIRLLAKYAARGVAGLAVMVLVWSCATVPGLREETTGTLIRIPFVRVLLDENLASVTVDAEGSFAVECLKSGRQNVYYSSRPVEVRSVGARLEVRSKSGETIESDLDEVNIIPRGNNNRVEVNKKRYRGLLRMLPVGQNVELVNVVYMEDYLKGVVPPEIGKRSDEEVEAVKAQAVAARTYAMAHLKQYEGEQYDMKSSIVDQVYDGVNVENKTINKAIEMTAGRVAVYQDNFINAYYHSTCGGMTDNISDIWDRAELPYLKAVSDSGACSWSKYYVWSEHFTEPQLRGRVEQYLASDRGRDLKIARITDVSVEQRTAGGRAVRLVIRTDNDVYSFYKDRIRWVIGRTSNPDLILPSDRFDVDIERNGSGALEGITFKGRGYGHGVGMCQCGAIGFSRQGWTFDRILKHYYTGIEVKKLY
jgi:stage II sporulation protein D